jgi:hypothetical protein
MIVTFTILTQEKLILEKYAGYFDLNDYMKFKEQEYSSPDFKPYYNLLVDLRNVYEHKPPDFVAKSIGNYLKSNPEKIGKRKTAFITSEPFQVVNTILYSEYAKESLPISVNRFSTFEAAIDWLGINDKEWVRKELEKLL